MSACAFLAVTNLIPDWDLFAAIFKVFFKQNKHFQGFFKLKKSFQGIQRGLHGRKNSVKTAFTYWVTYAYVRGVRAVIFRTFYS